MAARCFMSFGLPQRTHRNLTIFAATESCKQMEEAAMMFLVELLSGGIFTVYAVDAHEDLFLIYRDDQWNWIGMEKCKPYTYPLGGSSFGGGTAI